MKTIHCVVIFLKKHAVANFLITLEIVFALTVITFIMNRYNYLYQTYNTYKNTAISQSIFFMGRDSYTASGSTVPQIDASYQAALQSQLDSLGYVKGISTIGRFATKDQAIVFVYDPISAPFLKGKVSGDWLFESNNPSSHDIVVYNGGNVAVGDEITLDLSLYNQFATSANPNFTVEEKTATFNVIGIEQTLPANLLWSTIKSNGSITMNELFMQKLNYVDQTIYFIPYSDELFADYKFSTDNFFIYLTAADATEHDTLDLEAILTNYGYSLRGSSILQGTEAAAHRQFESDLFMFVTVAGIALVSLLSITFLNVKKLMKTIGIYYLNGCSMKKALLIYAYYLMTLFVAAVFAYSVYMIYQYNQVLHDVMISDLALAFYSFNWPVLLETMLVTALLMGLGSFIPFMTIAKKSKIGIWKGSL